MRTQTQQELRIGDSVHERACFQQLVEIPVDLPGGRCCRALTWIPEVENPNIRGAVVISVAGFEWVVCKRAMRRSRLSVNQCLPAA